MFAFWSNRCRFFQSNWRIPSVPQESCILSIPMNTRAVNIRPLAWIVRELDLLIPNHWSLITPIICPQVYILRWVAHYTCWPLTILRKKVMVRQQTDTTCRSVVVLSVIVSFFCRVILLLCLPFFMLFFCHVNLFVVDRSYVIDPFKLPYSVNDLVKLWQHPVIFSKKRKAVWTE